VVFDAEKRLRQFLWELPQFLLPPVAVDFPLLQIALPGATPRQRCPFPICMEMQKTRFVKQVQILCVTAAVS